MPENHSKVQESGILTKLNQELEENGFQILKFKVGVILSGFHEVLTT
jgi:hypothetical protein